MTDDEAVQAARDVATTEGIIVALESAHAFGALAEIARREAQVRQRPVRVAVCLSGRGDKDLSTLAAYGRR